MQLKQKEWHDQWSIPFKEEEFLFDDWIYPNKLDDLRGKTVLDAGCGHGQHSERVAKYAMLLYACDLNASDIARKRLEKYSNVTVVEADIATMKLDIKFDIIYSIGVIHHTFDPAKTFKNLVKHLKSGGKIIIWVYSYEGNFLNRVVLEPLKRYLFLKLPKPVLFLIARLFMCVILILIHTVYRLPLRFLPFYEYFNNMRKLTFYRATFNIFDKLNAPTTNFLKKDDVISWFSSDVFDDVHISPYVRVSWRASGRLK